MKKQKFYVVWVGVTPGIYRSWTECQLQTKGYAGAKYKSFDTLPEAEAAFASAYADYIRPVSSSHPVRKPDVPVLPPGLEGNALAVDAACSGNPGRMEYRGVHLPSFQQVFHFGPQYGTKQHRRVSGHRSCPGLVEAEGAGDACLQRQPECHRLGAAEEVQNQASPRCPE